MCEEKHSETRRNVLKSIGIGSVSATAFSGIGASEQPDSRFKNKRKVRKAGEETKEKVIKGIKKKGNSKVLIKHFKREGWKLSMSEKNVWDASDIETDERSQVATIPLKPKESLQQQQSETTHESADTISRTLIWANINSLDRNVVVRETNLVENTRSIYAVENEEVVEEVFDIETPPNQDPTIMADPDCVHTVEECVDPNWSCIIPILVEAAICTAAAFSREFKTVVACLNTAGWGVIQFIQHESCSICDNTDIRTYDTCGDEWEIMSP